MNYLFIFNILVMKYLINYCGLGIVPNPQLKNIFIIFFAFDEYDKLFDYNKIQQMKLE